MTFRKFKKKMKKYTLYFSLIYVLVWLFNAIETEVMPSIIAMGEIEAKTMANSIIDTAVKIGVSGHGLKSGDFFIYDESSNSYSANTILINELCADVSSNINEGTAIFEERKIAIALGALSGFDLISNLGPRVSFDIHQMGAANVDYETSFSSMGINQTNYKVWIDVALNIRLVNPLKSNIVTANRKIMLIDTVIEGEVPENFINF